MKEAYLLKITNDDKDEEHYLFHEFMNAVDKAIALAFADADDADLEVAARESFEETNLWVDEASEYEYEIIRLTFADEISSRDVA